MTASLMLQAGNVAAQSPTLVGQMSDLFLQSIVLARTPTGSGLVAHTPVFVDSENVTDAEQLIAQVNQQIGAQVSNFPLGSSASGFTFAYDPSLGTFSRTTETFGPSFAERAATLGSRRMSFGMTYLHTGYSTLDGRDLRNGDIAFNLLHQPLTPASYVEGDVVQATLGLGLSSNTTAFQFDYGVSNRLDLGVAIPIVQVGMQLTYHATILDFSTHTVSPTTHLFANGTKTQDFSSNGSASGVGDVVLRGKYRLEDIGAISAAIGVDLRLPTGDENNMLGTGYAQTKTFLILSSKTSDRIAPHLNIGYTFGRSSNSALNPTDAFNYTGGVEVLVTPKVTIVADLVGRRLNHAQRLSDALTPHSYQQGPTAPAETATLTSVAIADGALGSVLGSAGAKFNLWRNLLVSANLLLPTNSAGLRIKPTPVIGFDYSF
ncbi:MAG: transporter [Vicinamibacterales bacterium]